MIDINRNNIDTIITDFDGVLTDNRMIMLPVPSGMECDIGESCMNYNGLNYYYANQVNVLDGVAVQIGKQLGIKFILITGRKSKLIQARCYQIGFDLVFTGISNKHEILEQLSKQINYPPRYILNDIEQTSQLDNGFQLDLNRSLYIGDDLIDGKAMNLVKFKVAPQDATLSIKKQASYITNKNGGYGVLREVVDLIASNTAYAT